MKRGSHGLALVEDDGNRTASVPGRRGSGVTGRAGRKYSGSYGNKHGVGDCDSRRRRNRRTRGGGSRIDVAWR